MRYHESFLQPFHLKKLHFLIHFHSFVQAMKSYQSITVVKTLLDHRASPHLPGERGPALEKKTAASLPRMKYEILLPKTNMTMENPP